MNGFELHGIEPAGDLLFEVAKEPPTASETLRRSAQAAHAPSTEQRERLLSALKVEMDVRLGTLEVSASTILDMAEGCELEMRIDPARPLLLTLGSEPVAEVALAQVDCELLGLRVLKIIGSEEETNHSSGRLTVRASAEQTINTQGAE